MTFDSASDLRDLLALYAAAEQASETAGFLERPVSDKWSPGEHLHHVELVNRGVLGALRFIATGRGNDAAVSPDAISFLQGGVFPVRVAPATVQPPADLSAEMVTELRAANRARWRALDAAALSEQASTIPHPFLGPLGAAEWVRFALVHARHHHALAGV